MSLAQAVLDVAEAMEKEVVSIAAGTQPGADGFGQAMIASSTIKSFARELRTAVKAAGALPQAVQHAKESPLIIPSHSSPGTVKKEDAGERMVICAGGSFDGDTFPVPPDAPIGAFIPVAEQEVYQLAKDANGNPVLKFSAAQTLRYQEQKQ